MRADRLVSIMLLLQARGRTTARELAAELEVAERTIYRDMDALSAAGVPVYADRGRGGGFALLDSYRTTLTGMTEEEIQALFMLSIPAPLARLGVGADLKAAMRKLSAALPASRRVEERRVRRRILLDPEPWPGREQPAPHLALIQRAVWDDRLINLTRRLRFGAELKRLVAPYSLVAKSGAWYLVCGYPTDVRVHGLDEVADVTLTDDRFQRPPDFDLASFWSGWLRRRERIRPRYTVVARVDVDLLVSLPSILGESGVVARESIAADGRGWATVELEFETFYTARSSLLGLGGAVEVVAPRALRDSVADFALQAVRVYESP